MEQVVRYSAKIINNMHKTVHGVGRIEGGTPIMHSIVPDPEMVQICEKADGVYLLYMNSEGEVVADTWHASVGDAMKQAEFEFGILNDDWTIL